MPSKAKLDGFIQALAAIRDPKCTKEQRDYLCGEDYQLFFTYYFVDHLKYPFADFHWEMFQDLRDLEEGVIRDLIWMMFRESAKTSIAEGFVTWCIVYKKRKYINIDSYDDTTSERFLYSVIHNLQANPLIVHDFGHLYNQSRDPNLSTVKRQMDFIATNGVRVEGHTTGTSVRGRKHLEQRPDLLVIDDFETNKTKDSVADTQKVIKHIDEFKSGLGPGAWIIYLCNYIVEDGSVNHLLEQAKDDHRMRVRNVPVLDGDGQPTWPGKYVLTDAEAVGTDKVSIEDKKRQLTMRVFYPEMMNEPVTDDSSPFKKAMFVPVAFDEVIKKRTACYVTIDTPNPKMGEEVGEDGDYFGFCVNWVDTDAYWNLKAWRKHLGPTAFIAAVIDLYEYLVSIGTPPQAFAWEDTGFTRGLEVGLRNAMRERGVFFSIHWLKPAGRKKEDRIRTGLLARYESRSIRHIEGECGDLERELGRFPNALHDDCSDATAYQADIARKPGEVQVPRTTTAATNPNPYQRMGLEVADEQPQFSDIGI